jgi:hypothetical protein
MPAFETPPRGTPQRENNEDWGHHATEISLSRANAEFEQARVAELTPLLREEARLKLEVNASEQSLARARQIRPLTQRTLEAVRKRAMSGTDLDEAVAKDVEAASELAERERRHADALSALQAVQADLKARDAELRSRFGLG